MKEAIITVEVHDHAADMLGGAKVNKTRIYTVAVSPGDKLFICLENNLGTQRLEIDTWEL